MRRRHDYARIVMLRRAGLTYQAIAREVGCSGSSITNALRWAGVPIKRYREEEDAAREAQRDAELMRRFAAARREHPLSGLCALMRHALLQNRNKS